MGWNNINPCHGHFSRMKRMLPASTITLWFRMRLFFGLISISLFLLRSLFLNVYVHELSLFSNVFVLGLEDARKTSIINETTKISEMEETFDEHSTSTGKAYSSHSILLSHKSR